MSAPLEISDIDLAAPLCAHCEKPEWRHIGERLYCYAIWLQDIGSFAEPGFDSRKRFAAVPHPNTADA